MALALIPVMQNLDNVQFEANSKNVGDIFCGKIIIGSRVSFAEPLESTS